MSSTHRIGTGLRANPVRGRKMAAVQYRWLLRQQVTGISQLPPRLALQERKLQEVVECAAFQMPFSSVLPPPVTVHGQLVAAKTPTRISIIQSLLMHCVSEYSGMN